MSNDQDKIKSSTRRHKTESAIAKQVKIAKGHGLTDNDKVIKESNRLSKHHAMDCGNPECGLCGNPRKIATSKDKLTAQEKRLYQDVDKNICSNGILPEEE